MSHGAQGEGEGAWHLLVLGKLAIQPHQNDGVAREEACACARPDARQGRRRGGGDEVWGMRSPA